MPYVAPKLDARAFTCPHCGVYSSQYWKDLFVQINRNWRQTGLKQSLCLHCNKSLYWYGDKIVIPEVSTAPSPSPDMPKAVRELYNEARGIVSKSSRGAAALLRLGIQELCFELGYKKDSINDAIAKMVKTGLPERTQKALDSVRVVGNNAVHPGEINVKDNPQTAEKLFHLTNFIVEKMITEPKEVDEFFEKLPEKDKENIKKRDSKKNSKKQQLSEAKKS